MNWLELQDVAAWVKSPGKAQESPRGFPMFQTQHVSQKKKTDIGVSGRGELLLAENVDTVWYIETKDRKTRFSTKDGERFLKIREELQEQYPDLFIRGIMLTSAPLDDDAKAALEEEDCMLVFVPEEKRGNTSL